MLHQDNWAQYTVLRFSRSAINSNSMYMYGCVNVLLQIPKGMTYRRRDRLFCMLEVRAMGTSLKDGQITTQ